MTTFFHTTDAAEVIMQDGFRDGEGSYMFVGLTLRGVFIADTPLDGNEGAKGEQVLAIDVPDAIDLSEFELVQDDGLGYREWCVPAALLNAHTPFRLVADDELERLTILRWTE